MLAAGDERGCDVCLKCSSMPFLGYQPSFDGTALRLGTVCNVQKSFCLLVACLARLPGLSASVPTISPGLPCQATQSLQLTNK